jgi:hypothetical protein
MDSRADEYRQRAFKAEQRARQAKIRAIKEAYDQVATDWFAVAEQVEWLERRGPFRLTWQATWQAIEGKKPRQSGAE